ncbi:MAG TPA: hypothetical protein VEU33_04545, partial [Archangium sp.]|nr:hypothetical protein [Archangium sp.]
MESLESRLELLERRCRRLQSVTLAALALGALGVGVALLRPGGASAGGELVASRLTLMDSQGRTRATLSAQEDGEGGLVLHDTQGRPRALLGVDASGSPRLRFATAEGSMLAELTVYSDEAPRLVLGNSGGSEFFSVGLMPDGS